MTIARSVSRIATALAVVALAAAACSSSATPAPSAGQTAAASAGQPSAATGTKTYKDLTIGFIQTGSESGWRAANTTSFKETATQLGINLKFYDAQNKLENQVSAFHQFNQDPSVNVIILAALDVTGYDDVLKEAKTAGKVVILEDRRIDADPSLYYTYIGSDFEPEEEHRRDLRRRRRLRGDRPGQGLPREDGRLRHDDRFGPHPDGQLGRARVQGRHGGLPQEDP